MALRRYRADPPKHVAVVDQRGRITQSWSAQFDALWRPSTASDVDVAHNPASLTTGAWEVVAVAAQGVRPGDFVAASFDPPDTYIQVHGTVAADDVITVQIWNVGPGTVALPAGTIRVRFWSHNP
jgi:hypothetical protein